MFNNLKKTQGDCQSQENEVKDQKNNDLDIV